MLKEWENRLAMKEKNLNEDPSRVLTYQKSDKFLTYRSTDCNNIEELKYDRYGIGHNISSNDSSDPDSNIHESQ